MVAASIRASCSPARVRSHPWRRSLLASDGTLHCAFCLTSLPTNSPSTFFSFLVPQFLGGSRDPDNRLVTCRACANARGSLDVLGWPAFGRLGTPDSRAALITHREQLLHFSDNHLTQTTRWATRARVHAALLSRFQHSRIRVFAHDGLVGWTGRCGGRAALAQAAGILRFGFQATHVAGLPVTLFRVPADLFLDGVWALIEHGALVSPVAVAELPTPRIDPSDWRTAWPLTFQDPADIRRRRARLAGNQVRVTGSLAAGVQALRQSAKATGQSLSDISGQRFALPAPAPARALSSHPASQRSRERYRRKVSAQRKQAWLQARSSLLELKQRIGEKRAPAMDAELLRVMEQKVADLYACIDRW